MGNLPVLFTIVIYEHSCKSIQCVLADSFAKYSKLKKVHMRVCKAVVKIKMDILELL
jgi:hypothetical protein